MIFFFAVPWSVFLCTDRSSQLGYHRHHNLQLRTGRDPSSTGGVSFLADVDMGLFNQSPLAGVYLNRQPTLPGHNP